MNEFYRSALLCVIVLVFINFSKKHFPEFTSLIALSCGIIILFYAMGYLRIIINAIKEFIIINNSLHEYFPLVLKVFTVSILCEFLSQLCTDSGETFLSDKIIFFGKIVIFANVIPYIIVFLNQLFEVIKSI